MTNLIGKLDFYIGLAEDGIAMTPAPFLRRLREALAAQQGGATASKTAAEGVLAAYEEEHGSPIGTEARALLRDLVEQALDDHGRALRAENTHLKSEVGALMDDRAAARGEAMETAEQLRRAENELGFLRYAEHRLR